MTTLDLQLIPGNFTIHRFNPSDEIPVEVFGCEFFSISRTKDEISIVVPSSLELNSAECNKDWACIRVLGTLDFKLTGILSMLSGVLAEAQISIFAISTYDTDYIFVKTEKKSEAVAVLEAAGHKFW